MKEIYGNLWDYFFKEDYAIAITTNGFVKNNGEAVMGRGCAWEATKLLPEVTLTLGVYLEMEGNHVHRLEPGVYSFPVKHNWWEKADIELIKRSCEEISKLSVEKNIVMPRMGCGNGGLKWEEEVKPVVGGLLDSRFKVITWRRHN